MKENKIKQAMESIHLSEEKKRDVWEAITRQEKHAKFMHRRVIAAAAVLVLLLIPTGVYAAGGFQWPWKDMGEKNNQLDKIFKKENACVEDQGFRFCLEQAFCDSNMGVAYIYISVTDISGKGRDPEDFYASSDDADMSDILYDIQVCGSSSSSFLYDKKNSNSETAYYYIEADSLPDDPQMKGVEISFSKLYDNKSQDAASQNAITRMQISSHILEFENVVQLPVLTWQTGTKENGREGEVKISPVIARVSNVMKPQLEIVLKDGTKIKDYFEMDEGGDNSDTPENIPDDSFASKMMDDDEIGTTYRFDYTDIEQISGIYLNGKFYSVDEALLTY